MITQEEMDLLTKAVDIIVDNEQQNHPEENEDFWKQFHEVILATAIERHEELLA